MEQTPDTMFRATIRHRALLHLFAHGVFSGERRKPRPTPTRTRCKARTEKWGHFTPDRNRVEETRIAREVSVYQALERTEGVAEGEDGRAKSGRFKKHFLMGFE